MKIWEQRFEEVIHEVNNHESPLNIRWRELNKIIERAVIDIRTGCKKTLGENFHPGEINISEELWEQFLEDELFMAFSGIKP